MFRKSVFILFGLMSVMLSAQGTLRNSKGEIFRAIPMVISKFDDSATQFAENRRNWWTIRNDFKMNAVRLNWLGPFSASRGWEPWSVDEVLEHIDKCVQNASATGLDIIINYHGTGENSELVDKDGIKRGVDFNRNMNLRTTFWRAVAKRYKNYGNVYFELLNEPVFNSDAYLNPQFKANFMKLYYMVRFLAPNRQLLLFSFNGTHYDIEKVVENYKNQLDWNKVTIAYHAYHDNTTDKVKRLMQKYRVMCTEWDYPGSFGRVRRIDGEYMNAQTFERLGIGWCDWYNKGKANNFRRIWRILLPNARSQNYWWGNKKPIKFFGTRGAPVGKFITLRKTGGDRKLISVRSPEKVRADADESGWSETFRVERHFMGGIALRSQATGKYLRVLETTRGTELRADGTGIQRWEQFEWNWINGIRIGLRSGFNGRFITAQHGVNNDIVQLENEGTFGNSIIEARQVKFNGKPLNGKKEVTTTEVLTLTPNPVGQDIYLSGVSNVSFISIYSLTGALLDVIPISNSTETNSVRIPVPHLVKGTYFIKTSSGNALRFIKK